MNICRHIQLSHIFNSSLRCARKPSAGVDGSGGGGGTVTDVQNMYRAIFCGCASATLWINRAYPVQSIPVTFRANPERSDHAEYLLAFLTQNIELINHHTLSILRTAPCGIQTIGSLRKTLVRISYIW